MAGRSTRKFTKSATDRYLQTNEIKHHALFYTGVVDKWKSLIVTVVVEKCEKNNYIISNFTKSEIIPENRQQCSVGNTGNTGCRLENR